MKEVMIIILLIVLLSVLIWRRSEGARAEPKPPPANGVPSSQRPRGATGTPGPAAYTPSPSGTNISQISNTAVITAQSNLLGQVESFIMMNMIDYSNVSSNVNYTLNILSVNQCPIAMNSTINSRPVIIRQISDAQTASLKNIIKNWIQTSYVSLGASTSDVNSMTQNVDTALTTSRINSIAATTLNTQTNTVNVAMCSPGIVPTSIARAIAINLGSAH